MADCVRGLPRPWRNEVKQAMIGLVLQWLDNSQTYSGMMTPSAAPRRRPVPREESLDMCAPSVMCEGRVYRDFVRCSPENVKDSGRMPTPKDVSPSRPESDKRTSSVDMML